MSIQGFLSLFTDRGFPGTLITWFLDLLNLPDSPFLRAIAGTLVLFLGILVCGCLVNFVSSVITGAFTFFLGSKIAFVIRNYLSWPGTVHHELSHALMGFLTGAKIVKIVVFPSEETLGHVDFYTRGNKVVQSLQLSISAVAPVICGFVTEGLLYFYVLPFCSTWWQYLILGYFMVSILFHMTLSPQDLKNLVRGLLPTVLVFFVLILAVELFLFFFGPDETQVLMAY